MPERHDCPSAVAKRLSDAGGLNPFNEPMFRLVWGWNRIIKMHGEWGDGRIDTREVPKYLPGDRWFLEMWNPPESYGTPETWKERGLEVHGFQTVDTAGPFPSRGDYELHTILSSDGTIYGAYVPLYPTVVEKLVQAIRWLKEHPQPLHVLRNQIVQRVERERQARISETADSLLDARPAFYDQPTSFGTGPKIHKVNSDLWVPEQYRN